MKKAHNLLVLSLLLILSINLQGEAVAAFNLSVRPFDGGNDLRFEKVNNFGAYTNKEVIVGITSDILKQYQVIQTLLEPLTNLQGVSIPQNNFFVYGIRGSNQFGTLSVEQEIPVSLGRSIIYTSNAQGPSDTFNLVYVLKYPFSVPSGSYRGRIAFILEPIDAAQQQVTVILNMYAEINAESSIEIRTATGSKVISLDSSREETKVSDVLFDIKGGLGSSFRISQFLPRLIESNEGVRLPFEAVNFKISRAKAGSGPVQPVPLSNRQDIVYSSGPRGDVDSFVITYGLVEPEKQRAGKFKASIRYGLDGRGLQQNLGDYFLEIEIARIFDLIITPELGGVVEFRDLKPKDPPRHSEVMVEIKNNTGKRYQISQQLMFELVSQEGKAIPSENFTLKEESLDTKGRLLFPSYSEVKQGETVLFISDNDGSPDRFKVIYTLTPSFDIPAGDYSTHITFSLSEL